MSVRTMSLVFEYDMPELKTDDGKTVPDSTAKFVLLALADHASDEGEGAYPGVKRICKKTSMSSQTVCNALNALRHSGYTTLLDEKSKSGTNSYVINLEKLSQPLGFQPIESGDSSPKNPTIPAARVKPSVNHQDNHDEVIKAANKKMDAYLKLAQSPGMRRQARIDSILSYLAGKLHINTETKRWKDFAKFVDDRQQDGQKVDVFIQWLKSQKNFDIQFWPPSKMQEMWPQAFIPVAAPRLDGSALERLEAGG